MTSGETGDEEPVVDLTVATPDERQEITALETSLIHSSAPPAHSAASAALEAWLKREGERSSFFPKEEAKSTRLLAIEALLPSTRPPEPDGGDRPATEAGSQRGDGVDDLAPSSKPPPRTTLTPAADASTTADVAQALRTVRRRAPASGSGYWGHAPAGLRARIELLRELSGTHRGRARAHLLSAAAELHAELDEEDKARQLRQQAHLADPREVIAMRRVRRDATDRGDLLQVRDTLEQEARLPLQPKERMFTLTALAELEVATAAPGTKPSPGTARRALSDDPKAHVVRLQLARRARMAGDLMETAHALMACARQWPMGAHRRALVLAAAHCFRHAGEPTTAMKALDKALSQTPASTSIPLDEAGLVMESVRCALAAGKEDALPSMLSRLSVCLKSPGAKAGADRMIALMQRDVSGDPASAHATLAPTDEPANLQLRAMCLLEAGEDPSSALSSWAEAASGDDRALALCEVALQHAQQGQSEAALSALANAAALGPTVTWVQLCRQALARKLGSAGDPEGVAATTESEALAAAAKLATGGDDVDRERQWLTRSQHARAGDPTTAALLLDMALADEDVSERDARLLGWAKQLDGPDQLGPLLLLSKRPTGPEALSRLGAQADAFADSPGWNASLLAGANDVDTLVAHFRQEAEAASGAWAATCWLLSASLHARTGHDPSALLQTAASDTRSPLAARALARHLRKRGDGPGMCELERARMDTAVGPLHRAVLAVRAALSTDDPGRGQGLLETARRDCPSDLILCDLLLRRGAVRAENMATYLECDLANRSKEMRRVARLRAARALEHSGAPLDARTRYEEVLAEHPRDPIATAGLARVFSATGDAEAMVAVLEESVPAAGPSHQCQAFTSAMHLFRHDRTAAAARLEALLPNARNHVPTLRALERHFGTTSDMEGLYRVHEMLAAVLDNAPDRTAYLQALAGAMDHPATGAQLESTLLEAAERVDREQLWYGVWLEGAARRLEDRELEARADQDISRLLDDPIERASYAIRAAEALEPMSNAEALSMLLAAGELDPNHPIVDEELGRLSQRSGELARAAEYYERAAGQAASERRAVRLWTTAATIYQDELGQLERARHALEQALAIDLQHPQAFDRMTRLLEHVDDKRGAADLLRRKLDAERDPNTAAELSLSLYEALLPLDGTEAALDALKRGMARAPTHIGLLDTLGRGLFEAGHYKEATEPLIQLARLVDSPGQLFNAFLTLGVIYHDHMDDLRRAEIALTHCQSLSADRTDVLERLVDIYERRQRPQRAAQALWRLSELTTDERAKERYTLRLIDILIDVDQAALAEQMLEQLQTEQPGRLFNIQAIERFYRRAGEDQARTQRMGRAADAFRAKVQADPADSSAWYGLLEVARLRGQMTGGAICASIARAAGIDRDEISGLASRAVGLSTRLSDPRVQLALRPEPLRGAAWAFIHATRPLLEALYPARARIDHATPVANADPWQAGAEAAARDLDMPVPALRAWKPRSVVAINEGVGTARDNATTVLLVAESMLTTTPPEQARWLCTRALLLCVERLDRVANLASGQFATFLDALWRLTDKHHDVPDDRKDAVEVLSQEMQRHLTRSQHERLSQLLKHLAAEGCADARVVHAATWELGARGALVACGDGATSFDALLHLAGKPGLYGDAQRRTASILRDPEARALLTYAIGEDQLGLLSDPGGGRDEDATTKFTTQRDETGDGERDR